MNTKTATTSRDFDWTLVRSFVSAMEHGSLLGAARALGLSQPTLGRHIAELEAQLGQTLFERTGRGLLPTEMALRLIETARQMESAASAITRVTTGAQIGLEGRVRISASQPIACVLLPPILAQMRLALPNVTVELVVSNQVSNLLKREADIALRMVQPEQGSLIARRLGQVRLGTYAHRDYLSRKGVPKKPADLLDHDLIGGDRELQIEEGFKAMGHEIDAARFVLRTDDFIAYAAALRAGMGIGFVADYLAKTDPQFVPLLPMLKLPALPLWLVVHRELRSSARIKAVYDFLVRAVPKAL